MLCQGVLQEVCQVCENSLLASFLHVIFGNKKPGKRIARGEGENVGQGVGHKINIFPTFLNILVTLLSQNQHFSITRQYFSI